MKSSLIYAIVTDSAGVQPIGCRLGPRPRDRTAANSRTQPWSAV